MKPFDLQRALAGDKFARKFDRREPLEWHYFKEKKDIVCFFGIEEDLGLYSINGKRSNYSEDHSLIMLPKTKKLWVAVGKEAYLTSNKEHYCTNAFITREYLEFWMRDYKHAELKDFNFIEIEVEE